MDLGQPNKSLNLQEIDADWLATDPPSQDQMGGAKLRKRQQKSHRVVALSDLDLIFFWLSLARYRTEPGGIPLPRQEEPNLLSFGPAPGGYRVREYIPILAAPVKPELYPSSDRGCLLSQRRLNRYPSIRPAHRRTFRMAML